MKTQYLMYKRGSLKPPKRGGRAKCNEYTVIYRHGVRQLTISDPIYLTDREFQLMRRLKGRKVMYLSERNPHYESFWEVAHEE